MWRHCNGCSLKISQQNDVAMNEQGVATERWLLVYATHNSPIKSLNNNSVQQTLLLMYIPSEKDHDHAFTITTLFVTASRFHHINPIKSVQS